MLCSLLPAAGTEVGLKGSPDSTSFLQEIPSFRFLQPYCKSRSTKSLSDDPGDLVESIC